MTTSLDRLHSCSSKWNVNVEATSETVTSLIGYGSRDGRAVVLKIIKHQCDEWGSGEVLGAFDASGAVRVYDAEAGAVLMERCEPGNNLVAMVREGNDERATEILAGVIQKLANHAPPPECPTVFDWARGFDRYLSSNDQQVPRDLAQEARELYLALANSSSHTMLLHADLQHYNVLFDSRRGWVAIDPKGVVGELEYEVGAALRNPVELPHLFTSPAVIQRRLEIFSTTLDLNYQRVLEWSFAQAVLSVIWGIEDGAAIEPDNPTLKLAHAIKLMR